MVSRRRKTAQAKAQQVRQKSTSGIVYPQQSSQTVQNESNREITRIPHTSNSTAIESEQNSDDDIIELPRQQESQSSAQSLLLWQPQVAVNNTTSILDDPSIFELVSNSTGSGLSLTFLDIDHYARFATRPGSAELLESCVVVSFGTPAVIIICDNDHDELNCGRYTFRLSRDLQDKIYWSRDRLSRWLDFRREMDRLARPFFTPTSDDVVIKDQGNKWQAGVDVAVWTRSLRLFPKSQPIKCAYHLHGSREVFRDFRQEPHARDRQAWKELSDVIDPDELSPEEATTAKEELVRLANAFFSGHAVPEDLSHTVAQAKGAINETEIAPNHVIRYKTRDWTQVLVTEILRRPVMTRFLVDVIVCNRLENCCQHRLTKFYGAIVQRDVKYGKIMDELDLSERENGDLTKELLELLKNTNFIGESSENGETSQAHNTAWPSNMGPGGESEVEGAPSKKKKKNRKRKVKSSNPKGCDVAQEDSSILEAESSARLGSTKGEHEYSEQSHLQKAGGFVEAKQSSAFPVRTAATTLAEKLFAPTQDSPNGASQLIALGADTTPPKQAKKKAKHQETSVMVQTGLPNITVDSYVNQNAQPIDFVYEASSDPAAVKSPSNENAGKFTAAEAAPGQSQPKSQVKLGNHDLKRVKKPETMAHAASTTGHNALFKKLGDRGKTIEPTDKVSFSAKQLEHKHAESSSQARASIINFFDFPVIQTSSQENDVGWNLVKARSSNKTKVSSRSTFHGSLKQATGSPKAGGRESPNTALKSATTLQKSGQLLQIGNKSQPGYIQDSDQYSIRRVAQCNSIAPMPVVSSNVQMADFLNIKNSNPHGNPCGFDAHEYPTLGSATKNFRSSSYPSGGLAAPTVASRVSPLDATTPAILLARGNYDDASGKLPAIPIKNAQSSQQHNSGPHCNLQLLYSVLGGSAITRPFAATSRAIPPSSTEFSKGHESADTSAKARLRKEPGEVSMNQADLEESTSNSASDYILAQETDVEYLLRLGESMPAKKSFTRATRSAPDMALSDTDIESNGTPTRRPIASNHLHFAGPRLLDTSGIPDVREPDVTVPQASEKEFSPASTALFLDDRVISEGAAFVNTTLPCQMKNVMSDDRSPGIQLQPFDSSDHNVCPQSPDIDLDCGVVGSDIEGTTLLSGTSLQTHQSAGIGHLASHAQLSPTRRTTAAIPLDTTIRAHNLTTAAVTVSAVSTQAPSDFITDASPHSGSPALFAVQAPTNDSVSINASNSQVMSPRSGNNQQVSDRSQLEASAEPHIAGNSVNTGSLPSAVGKSTALSDEFSTCTYCNQLIAASFQTPLFLCPGCGPDCNTRYCSVECLLVHAYQHCSRCINTGANSREISYNLPEEFRHIRKPPLQETFQGESREKHRQRTFFMFCDAGAFPNLMKVWTQVHGIPSNFTTQDILEAGYKKTGEYFIFRSRSTADATRPNPDAEVIFTISLRRADPLKSILRRTLVACFVLRVPALVEFLFRLLRHLIGEVGSFNMMRSNTTHAEVIMEFTFQFFREFGFEPEMQENTSNTFDAGVEWGEVSHIVSLVEAHHPGLREWSY